MTDDKKLGRRIDFLRYKDEKTGEDLDDGDIAVDGEYFKYFLCPKLQYEQRDLEQGLENQHDDASEFMDKIDPNKKLPSDVKKAFAGVIYTLLGIIDELNEEMTHLGKVVKNHRHVQKEIEVVETD